ncbi:symmetrical bis(5'-nucleosyl)-tetraphosphatase [Arsukibacterium sp.]|uniref:symmetrical bis(5'-nucleosyl)-tetraphosphatase n=1 Tax=Arsukibacterium sp. TaxID=1977258 RepID=UPI00299E8339|nr:symmetrical bis(5'-nucleosyl)-tetraphosphatase [Arsukibacterium sp.]MDX1676531.1 symmetrical bis(5'-nucleosyl)-tetraphosphatase [Arsukibacterium sp.]
MATYVIGDVQGCYDALQRLLQHICFNPSHDQLWFCGDLIARGPDSLSTLNFIKSLGDSAKCVLGNHDLHFLASHFGFAKLKSNDKLQQLQQAPNVGELVDWLLQLPLLYQSSDKQHLMVHAGLSPEWTLLEAESATAAVSRQLKHQPEQIFATMYGDTPAKWQQAETEQQRWRYTINACTRMRFCLPDGSLTLQEKGNPAQQSSLVPWYEFWRTKPHPQLFFGHWAALNGYSPVRHIHALDTGCVWGNRLTAYCIDRQQRYCVAGIV